MPKAQKHKELEKKSICYPHDAHLAFIACCISNPEVLANFDKLRNVCTEIIQYTIPKKETERVIISFEECSQNWRKAAHQVCSSLTYVFGEDEAEHMRRYLVAVPDMPNAKKHIMPGTGNTTPELFNKRVFIKCLGLPISRFNLYKGHNFCNQPMTHKGLVQLIVGADNKTGEICDWRCAIGFSGSNINYLESTIRHRGKQDAWGRSLLDLYIENASEVCIKL